MHAYHHVLTHLVIQEDGLVHYLLQLGVLQIVPHHHLQHLEQLSVGNKTIVVHVIDPVHNMDNVHLSYENILRRKNFIFQQ